MLRFPATMLMSERESFTGLHGKGQSLFILASSPHSSQYVTTAFSTPHFLPDPLPLPEDSRGFSALQ
jgi:hypothetical protein